MFSSPYFWGVVVIVILTTVCIIYYNLPSVKRKRALRKDEILRAQERFRREEVERAQRKREALDNLRKQRLVVHIREKDGRKSAFESILIKAFLNERIPVEPFPEDKGKKVAGGDTTLLPEGVFALVGTAWSEKTIYADHDLNVYHGVAFFCDYRLLANMESGKGRFVGAGYETAGAEQLTAKIITQLASFLGN